MYINIACIGIQSVNVFLIEFPLTEAFIRAIYTIIMQIILTLKQYLQLHSAIIFCKSQCKRVHIFIAQFAIFRVFQEVNGS